MADLVGVIGVVIFIIGAILFLVVAFKESIIWGIACLLITPVVLIFTVMHWEVAKKPFFIQLAGLGVMLMAAA